MAELPEIVRFLERLPAFADLDDTRLHAAAGRISIAYYRRGADILTVGAANRQLNIVRSGAVELRDGDGGMLMRLAEGDFFGLPSLMNAAPVRNHTVAIEDTLVYHFDGDTFEQLRRDDAAFDRYFIRALSDRLLTRSETPPFGAVAATSVRQLVGRPPVTLDVSATIRETAEKMVAERVSAMLITADERVCGIVTDRDIRSRVVAHGLPADGPIADIMTGSPITLDGDAQAYEAALLMMQENIHHLPVTSDGESDGELLGMISRSDFMRHETEHPLYLVGDIGKQTDAAGIAAVCKRLPELIARQIESNADGEQLGKFITAVSDTVTRQLLRIAEAELGTPPCAYAWVAMGSQGRREQSANSDQDNALILDTGDRDTDDAGREIDEYFAALATIVCDGLNACGYVYCPGDVMASNPKWRQPLARWKRYFQQWITVPEEKALMHASIFFDLRCVGGRPALVETLREDIREQARGNELFLTLMAKNATTYQPPLGFFRQFVLERSGEHKNRLDLKKHGIMPIVEIARIRALAAGAMRAGTRKRLLAAADGGEIAEADAANLIDALDFIEKLRLEHQSRQMLEGVEPDNHLAPEELSPLARQNLKAAFSQIRVSQSALLNRFHVA